MKISILGSTGSIGTQALEVVDDLKGIRDIEIYYDYEGISAWAEGRWKTNKDGTIAYKKAYDELSEFVNVTFCKVKGHSGDKYNDMADRLAKDALGIK